MGKTGSCPDEQGLIQCNFNPIICWWMWHYIPFLVVFWPKANFNPQIPWGFLRWESEFLFLELNFQIEHANIHCCMQANRIYIKEKKVQSSQHRYSVQFSQSVMSDSLKHHRMQYTWFPVHHQLLELAQTHIPWVSDTIQPSHPLPSPSPPSLNLSQH